MPSDTSNERRDVMGNNDEIILITRDEVNQLTTSPISNYDWERIREFIISDDNMWSVIDECIKNTVDEVMD
jgi:ethanolamine ammonia-lyase large subunit